MPITRRDFVKMLGISLASMLASRCNAALPGGASPRERLRRLWFSFAELAERTRAGRNDENAAGEQMIVEHRTRLDAIIAAGELSAPAAELVQEAYAAAVYHVWRSNAPITCYAPVMVDYAPSGANVLVKQAEMLEELSGQGTIDPATLAKARTALEHDLAFYQLSGDETQALYNRIIDENQGSGRPIPAFETLDLELTPDASEAARFILDLLSNQ